MKELFDIMCTKHKETDTLRLNMLKHIMGYPLFRSKRYQQTFLLIASVIFILSILVEASHRTEDLKTVEYMPLPRDDWKVSTPAEQRLDPKLVAELYSNAGELETLYGLLVIKNGYLIAEAYFNNRTIEQLSGRQSTTKSFTSTLVGMALSQGYLSCVEQKMMDFFPEIAGQIDDPPEGPDHDSGPVADAHRISR